MTSLIDVVFLLLVFFMLASTFLHYTGFDLSGGRSRATASADVNKLVIVRVSGDGMLDVNGRPVDLDRLADELTVLADGADVKVAVKPVTDARVQDVVDVIDRIRIPAVRDAMIVR